jgi:UDP-N-acetylmuramyl pentapeptide phosphotransferase/UDP-N-acetylglucosamine-1-phosphate transferase
LFGRTGESLRVDPRWPRLLLWVLAVAVLGHGLQALVPPVAIWRWLLTLLLLAMGPLLAAVLSTLWRARRPNYQGRRLPTLGGLALLPALAVPWLLLPGSALHGRLGWATVFIAAWVVLGLYDDVYGRVDRRGFRGHLAALRAGVLTTGGVKVLGGGGLALGAALLLPMTTAAWWLAVPVVGLLIAFSANAVNLFDLRPGRALKVSWLVGLPLVIIAAHLPIAGAHFASPWLAVYLPVLLAVLLATLFMAPFDFGGLLMLGDTGANPLGALLGVGLALLLPWPWPTAALVLLIALHAYAERTSITATIARVPWLAWLDRLGRSE